MKISIIATVAAILSLSAFTASAQEHHVLQNDNQRIRQGLNSGELTARETYHLKREEAHLRNEAIRYKANDGKIGPRERRDLRRDNRRLSRNIFIQKHDRQRRF